MKLSGNPFIVCEGAVEHATVRCGFDKSTEFSPPFFPMIHKATAFLICNDLNKAFQEVKVKYPDIDWNI